MNLQGILSIVSVVASVLLAPVAHAHAKLEKSQPAQGAVVSAAPKALDLTFNAATKLVSVKLVKGARETELQVDKSAPPSKSFSVPLPELADGQYQARYMTMARDGHPMSGTISFTLRR